MKSGRSQEYYENGRPKEIAWYKDNTYDGKMNKWYPNGKAKEQGFFDSGKRDGKWTFYYENGQVSQSGRFNDDKLSGQWKFYSAEGLLQKEGNYAMGKEADTWTFYQYPSKYKRLKSMELYLNGGMVDSGKESLLYDKKGNLTGKGQLSGIPKAIYQVKKNGKDAGTITTASVPADSPQGKIQHSWTGKWQHPKRNGSWTVYYPGTRNVKYKTTCMMGKLNGKYTEYFPNGKVKAEGEYLNGKMNGMWTFFTSNGSKDEKKSGRYMLGKKSSF
ncbi:MAG: toxin-antitoxin system YwqK family antitoxin [Spirochaetota bacterium]